MPRPSVNTRHAPALSWLQSRGAFFAPAALWLRDTTMAIRPDTSPVAPIEVGLPHTIRLGALRLPWLAAMVGIGACRAVTRPAGADCDHRETVTIDDAEYLTHDPGAGGEQEPQRERDAQHPLAHGLMRQHLVYQQGRALGHAPGAATWAEATALATEGHELLGMAARTAHAQEAMLQAAALEILIELARYVLRQGHALRGQLAYKRRVVLRDNLVEKSLFRAVALITVGAGTGAGLAVGASTARTGR